VPDHLSSGYQRPDRPTGRFPIQPAQHYDPKDGGIWEPVQRQYPKVPRVDYGNGVKIVDKPVNKDRPVDIWPATITVKDPFKPGGLRMFEGKRNTDVNAFPGAIGYTPPRNVDDDGNRIDYSSVDQGGPFGVKKLHRNSPVALPDGYQERYRPDTTSKSKTLGEVGERNKKASVELSGPQTGRHGSVFPFRPTSAARRAFTSQMDGGARNRLDTSASIPTRQDSRAASSAGAQSLAATADASSQRPPRPPRDLAQEEPIRMPPPPSYGKRAGSTSGSGSRASQAPSPAPSKLADFSPRGKQYYEFPLTSSTKWTFMGGFRP